jgi:hypothetical protein
MIHRRILTSFTLLLVLFGSLPARAQEPQLPVLEPQTMVLIKIDLNQVNVDLLQKWMLDCLAESKLPPAELEKLTQPMKQTFSQLGPVVRDLVMSGGTSMYITFGMQDMQYGPSVYIPVDPANGVPDAVAAIMNSGRIDGPKAPDVATITNPSARVIAPLGQGIFAGRLSTYRRIQANKDVGPQLVFATALASAPAGAAQGVFRPTDEMITTLETKMPTIPAPVNIPMTTLTRGIKAASAAIQPPPGPSGRLIIQAADVATATQLKELIDRLLPLGAAMLKAELPTLETQPMLEVVVPTVEMDKVVLTLDEPKLKKLIAGPLLLSLQDAQQGAVRAAAANQLRQILLPVLTFARQNQGKLPANMDEVKRLLGPIADRLLTNPRAINAEPAYLYVDPGVPLQQANRGRPLIYENPAALPPGTSPLNAAFPDGSVRMLSPQQLQQMLNAPAAQPLPPPPAR